MHGLSLTIDLLSRFLDPNEDGYLGGHTPFFIKYQDGYTQVVREVLKKFGIPEEKYQ